MLTGRFAGIKGGMASSGTNKRHFPDRLVPVAVRRHFQDGPSPSRLVVGERLGRWDHEAAADVTDPTRALRGSSCLRLAEPCGPRASRPVPLVPLGKFSVTVRSSTDFVAGAPDRAKP